MITEPVPYRVSGHAEAPQITPIRAATVLSYAVCVRRAAGVRWQPQQIRAQNRVVSAGLCAVSAWAPESSLGSSPGG